MSEVAVAPEEQVRRLERLIMQEQARLVREQDENKKLRSKIAKQRNEIARLTQKLEEIYDVRPFQMVYDQTEKGRC